MPRKKATLNETDIPAEAATVVRSPAKGVRKSRTVTAEAAKKPSLRRRAKVSGTVSAGRPIGESQLQPVLSEQVAATAIEVLSPPEAASEEAVSEHEQIALLAYQFWQARGCRDGSPEGDWLRAEQEFRRRREARLNGG